MTKLSDNWETPRELFDVLDKGGEYQGIYFDGFNFDIDLCATKENSKCNWYLNDFLSDRKGQIVHEIYGEPEMRDSRDDWRQISNCAFMNPPYSNPRPFIEKAWEDSKHCRIVCLVKVDPSTRWWSTFWEYSGMCTGCIGQVPEHDCMEYELYIGPKPGCEVVFFPKRIKFTPPKELIDSGEVWKNYRHCAVCRGIGVLQTIDRGLVVCHKCEGSCVEASRFNWVRKCNNAMLGCLYNDVCYERGMTTGYPIVCKECKGVGYKELSGPTFPSCLVIMDRRGL